MVNPARAIELEIGGYFDSKTVGHLGVQRSVDAIMVGSCIFLLPCEERVLVRLQKGRKYCLKPHTPGASGMCQLGWGALREDSDKEDSDNEDVGQAVSPGKRLLDSHCRGYAAGPTLWSSASGKDTRRLRPQVGSPEMRLSRGQSNTEDFFTNNITQMNQSGCHCWQTFFTATELVIW